MFRSTRVFLAGLLLGTHGTTRADAQEQDPARHTSRKQIEAEITEGKKILSSPGYSARIKQIKRQEITLLQSRLEDGDLQPGDQIVLSVEGEKDLTSTFTVSPSRTMALPGVADISLRGVLRSELEEYLTTELRKYLRNPIVHVQTTMRLSVLGSVGKPGFYQIDSERMVGDAIMIAGGPSSGVDPAKTHIERAGTVVLDRVAFADALAAGKTLDQMNLRAGDEIVVGGGRTARSGNTAMNILLPALSGLATVTYLLVQIVR